jgi:hypothetical protein
MFVLLKKAAKLKKKEENVEETKKTVCSTN